MVVTDDAGQFTVDALAPGQFALSASKPAYLTMNYGATKPERQGTSVALVAGQAVRGLTIELPKGAAIAGTIFDANGSLFPNAAVTILRWQMVDGERQYASVSLPHGQSAPSVACVRADAWRVPGVGRRLDGRSDRRHV